MPPSIPAAAPPRYSAHFDAWNSSSTGHQRAENRLSGSTGWRQSRSAKLAHQFRSRGTGGRRIADLVGAGATAWDDKTKTIVAPARPDVRDMLMSGARGDGSGARRGTAAAAASSRTISPEEEQNQRRKHEDETRQAMREQERASRGVLHGIVVYVNGSTMPVVSDHRLKQMLAENGAQVAIALGRRIVTHVVLGRACRGDGKEEIGGAGGGLAAGKLQKEITRRGGCAVKYVDVEW